MVVYEITAAVEEQFISAYETYLAERHVPDLMATRCFLSGLLSRTTDVFQIRYTAANCEALDAYIEQHADRLRQDALEHFPTGVQLSRQIWEVIAEF
jgi:uncharacterized protein DUF4286